MQMVLTLLGPETSAGATWQHLGLQNCTWSVQEGFILLDFLMDLRYLLTSTAILLFWVLSLPQNNPEHEAWTSMELCEPLITPPGFPEWRSLCFLLLLGSQGLNEVLGLVNASLTSGEELGVDVEPWGGLSSCRFTSPVWDPEEITSRGRRGINTSGVPQQASQSAGLLWGEEREAKHLLNLCSFQTLSLTYAVSLAAQLDKSQGLGSCSQIPTEESCPHSLLLGWLPVCLTHQIVSLLPLLCEPHCTTVYMFWVAFFSVS